MGAEEEIQGVLARVTGRNIQAWEASERNARAIERDAWLDIPDPEAMPTEEGQLYLWDRRNCLLTAEWTAFWRVVNEHEREQRAKHGPEYKGIDRALAAHTFRTRLTKVYGAHEPPHTWLVFDDERRRKLDKPERPVFPTTPMAQSREHLDPHWNDR